MSELLRRVDLRIYFISRAISHTVFHWLVRRVGFYRACGLRKGYAERNRIDLLKRYEDQLNSRDKIENHLTQEIIKRMIERLDYGIMYGEGSFERDHE